MSSSSSRPLRVLILGGSSDATALALEMVGRADIDATISLAGRTKAPAAQPLPARIGGFGGAEGLAAHLRAEAIDLLVDATHPFATRMSGNARDASGMTDTPLIRVERPPWAPMATDRWTEVADMRQAALAIGEKPRRAFLTIGRLNLSVFAVAPQHHYLVRSIDPVADPQGLPNVAFVEARPPFDVEAEARLMRDHRIDVLVTKNSGGIAAGAKLEAARALGLPVILVRRPVAEGDTHDVAGALAEIDAHAASARRDV